jgi:serine/threonine protein kinase
MPSPKNPLSERPTIELPDGTDQHASVAGLHTDETAVDTGASLEVKFGPPAGPNEVGTLGPYRVVKQLGRGGIGAVYLAMDTRLNRKLALKVMLPQYAADPVAKERFLREARATAQVAHDNVVTVYEADERDGIAYIAMQFLSGSPLDEYLRKKGTPSMPQVIRLAREAAAGLAAAHRIGLVHRDVKPANLWLEAPNGRVKVLDFGLAKPVDADIEVTKSGSIIGTPAYMSPEQARGLKLDARTDLFSLGAVLYRLCTGKSPFEGPSTMAVLTALAADDPRPIHELNPKTPEPLAKLIHQLLAKKPEQRPATADEVVRRLRGIAEEQTRSTAQTGGAGSATMMVMPISDPLDGLDFSAAHVLPLTPSPAKNEPDWQWIWVPAAAVLVVVAIVALIIGNIMGRVDSRKPPSSPPANPPSTSASG